MVYGPIPIDTRQHTSCNRHTVSKCLSAKDQIIMTMSQKAANKRIYSYETKAERSEQKERERNRNPTRWVTMWPRHIYWLYAKHYYSIIFHCPRFCLRIFMCMQSKSLDELPDKDARVTYRASMWNNKTQKKNYFQIVSFYICAFCRPIIIITVMQIRLLGLDASKREKEI